MKKNNPHFDSDNNPTVKEISDGVYINLTRITSEEGEFEKAVEESFKKLDEENKEHTIDQKNGLN